MSQRGAFIVIEGLDRSGKTTQVQLLKDELSKLGKDVQLLRFPGISTVFPSMSPFVICLSSDTLQTEQQP
jgi:dTMP kinase